MERSVNKSETSPGTVPVMKNSFWRESASFFAARMSWIIEESMSVIFEMSTKVVLFFFIESANCFFIDHACSMPMESCKTIIEPADFFLAIKISKEKYFEIFPVLLSVEK